MPMGAAGAGFKRKPQVRIKGRRPLRAPASGAKRTLAQAAMAKRPRTAADY
jgi:hypothetical protein